MSDVTRILKSIEDGDPQAAEELLPLVYDELRKLAAAKMAQEKPGQTLQATWSPATIIPHPTAAMPGGSSMCLTAAPARTMWRWVHSKPRPSDDLDETDAQYIPSLFGNLAVSLGPFSVFR